MLLYNLNFYDLPETELIVLRQMLLRRQKATADASSKVTKGQGDLREEGGIAKKARIGDDDGGDIEEPPETEIAAR